ncbi:MAG: hypothetical protein K6E10_04100, partial [Eubacterium sp.]|nr:hypothetical protein [Eubacterium sp.]
FGMQNPDFSPQLLLDFDSTYQIYLSKISRKSAIYLRLEGVKSGEKSASIVSVIVSVDIIFTFM